MPEKIIRDPIHDVIAFHLERRIDQTLFRLINTGEIQRLRRIRQLGMASLVYPGADHSRYSHSLGVMETARQMLDRLRPLIKIDEGDATAALAAALLHDLGHGPLSHVFESVSNVPHETITINIIHDPDTEVHRVLAENDRSLPARVAALLQMPRSLDQRTFYHDILSSQLDADRFDYLLRDNLMTGSKYGGFDLRWLLYSLTVDRDGSRLAVTSKGVSAAEAYLQSRYHMYRNVYFHKVVRTAEGMLKLALQRAKQLANENRLPGDRDTTFKALVGAQLTSAEFTQLDDISLLHCLKQWTASEDAILARLSHGLLQRRLYKTIDLSSQHPAEIQRSISAAKSAIIAAGGDAEYDLFYDEPGDTPYEIYDGQSTTTDIFVQDSQGRLSSFALVSPLTLALSRELMFRRLHVSPEYRDAVQAAVGKCV